MNDKHLRLLLLCCVPLCIIACAAPCTAQASQPLTPPATLIQLKPGQTALSEVLSVIARQSGVVLRLSSERDDPLVEIGDAPLPFWPTILDIQKQSKMHLTDYGTGQRSLVAVRDPPPVAGPTCSWGGTVLVLVEACRDYNRSYGSRDWNSSSFKLSGCLYVDPALEILAIKPEPLDLYAVDENQKSLVPTKPAELEWLTGGRPGSMVQGFSWNLAYPEGAGHRIASLRGKMLVSVAEEFRTLTVDSPLTSLPVRIQIPDGELCIESLTMKPAPRNQQACELKFVLTRAPGPKGPVRNITAHGLTIQDAAGHAYQSGGGGVNGGDKTATYTINLGLYGPDAGPPQKLTWRLPKRITQREIPFDFSNLAIPE